MPEHPFPPELWEKLLEILRGPYDVTSIVLVIDPKTRKVTRIRPELSIGHKRVC
jgi:hypothetical protein